MVNEPNVLSQQRVSIGDPSLTSSTLEGTGRAARVAGGGLGMHSGLLFSASRQRQRGGRRPRMGYVKATRTPSEKPAACAEHRHARTDNLFYERMLRSAVAASITNPSQRCIRKLLGNNCLVAVFA